MNQEDLLNDEQILQQIKGDYWINTILFIFEQRSGEIVVTNKRILFYSKIFNKLSLDLALNLLDIEIVEKCGVGNLIPINPTGVKIKLKNGREFKLSSYHFNKLFETIDNLIDNKNKQ